MNTVSKSSNKAKKRTNETKVILKMEKKLTENALLPAFYRKYSTNRPKKTEKMMKIKTQNMYLKTHNFKSLDRHKITKK